MIFSDEACFQLMPTRRRTLAPRGETPKLIAWDKRGKISVIGAITISPKTGKKGFLFQMLPADLNFNGNLIVEFLRFVRYHVAGPIKLIWDGAPVHRAKVVTKFLSEQTRIETFRQPAYAPDTNPVEGCWGHAKYHQLPNLAAKNAEELRERAIESLNKIKRSRSLIKAFIKHAHESKQKPSRLSIYSTQ